MSPIKKWKRGLWGLPSFSWCCSSKIILHELAVRLFATGCVPSVASGLFVASATVNEGYGGPRVAALGRPGRPRGVSVPPSAGGVPSAWPLRRDQRRRTPHSEKRSARAVQDLRESLTIASVPLGRMAVVRFPPATALWEMDRQRLSRDRSSVCPDKRMQRHEKVGFIAGELISRPAHSPRVLRSSCGSVRLSRQNAQARHRQAKYSENKLKSIKARNEYLLTLEATNASVFKYYVRDLSDLIDCCDLGYHASLNRALRTYLSAEYNLETSRHEGLDIIENAVDNLEPRSDKQRLLEMFPAAFCPPLKFEFQSHMGDEVSDSCGVTNLLSTLMLELTQCMCMGEAVQDSGQVIPLIVESCVRFINLYDSYLGLRLLGPVVSPLPTTRSLACAAQPPGRPRSVRSPAIAGVVPLGAAGRDHEVRLSQVAEVPDSGPPREADLPAEGRDGVTRPYPDRHALPHAQLEGKVGENPLADDQSDHDINSVAGVLKLYFRGLENPLFPKERFNDLISCITYTAV
ncbi:PREDICTED: uncharacterized protein LOC105854326 [Condylura cristata]|uniref:uncharacterized protein LOC105854326 n=1 Tax=Condylura cristata TaxID=143302 RepID=UPI0006431BFD|nr:PREDICTED: uncharacterized protein LOC105854326 [Condylura cristata]